MKIDMSVISVFEDTNIKQALKQMSIAGQRILLVVHEENILLGVLDSRTGHAIFLCNSHGTIFQRIRNNF